MLWFSNPQKSLHHRKLEHYRWISEAFAALYLWRFSRHFHLGGEPTLYPELSHVNRLVDSRYSSKLSVTHNKPLEQMIVCWSMFSLRRTGCNCTTTGLSDGDGLSPFITGAGRRGVMTGSRTVQLAGWQTQLLLRPGPYLCMSSALLFRTGQSLASFLTSLSRNASWWEIKQLMRRQHL